MSRKIALQLLNLIRHGGGENVALNYSRILNMLGVDSIFVGKPSSADYASLLEKEGTIKDKLSISQLRRADYIFVHTNRNLLLLFFKYYFFLDRSRQKIFYIQHLLFDERKFKMLSFFINAVCTDFIQITPVTDTFVKAHIKVPVHFVVNFYSNKYAETDYPKIRRSVRESLNIEHNRKVIVFSGVFKPGKGLDDFLELADKLNTRNDYFFLLIGDGPEVAKVNAYKHDNLKWLGFVNDVEYYLIASDVYFFPSVFKQEMMPMALLEAMNVKKYIIAYHTAINNFLLDGNTFSSLDEILETLEHGQLQQATPRYDKAYALSAMKELLAD